MDHPSDSGDRAVIATIVGAVVAVAAIGAGWIWRQARRHRDRGTA
jgi:cobalamin biosynthesis Mg chelatase CobN